MRPFGLSFCQEIQSLTLKSNVSLSFEFIHKNAFSGQKFKLLELQPRFVEVNRPASIIFLGKSASFGQSKPSELHRTFTFGALHKDSEEAGDDEENDDNDEDDEDDDEELPINKLMSSRPLALNLSKSPILLEPLTMPPYAAGKVTISHEGSIE